MTNGASFLFSAMKKKLCLMCVLSLSVQLIIRRSSDKWYRIANNTETVSFQRAPFHLLSIVLASTLKNAVLHWLATALARIVLPVPGGPKRRIPL